MLKTIGAACVIVSSSYCGLHAASGVHRQKVFLSALIDCFYEMKAELAYRMTPMHEIFRGLQTVRNPSVSAFFEHLADRTENSTVCLRSVILDGLEAIDSKIITNGATEALRSYADSAGVTDLEGQIAAVSVTIERLEREMTSFRAGAAERCKCYCSVGICCGLALAIILV